MRHAHRDHDAIRSRDRALRTARRMTRGVAIGALALTGALSAVAAHAVKGHAQSASPAQPQPQPQPRVTVPPAQQVPQIDGVPPAPQPPAQPPQPAPAPAPAPQPAPVVSGGS